MVETAISIIFVGCAIVLALLAHFFSNSNKISMVLKELFIFSSLLFSLISLGLWISNLSQYGKEITFYVILLGILNWVIIVLAILSLIRLLVFLTSKPLQEMRVR